MRHLLLPAVSGIMFAFGAHAACAPQVGGTSADTLRPAPTPTLQPVPASTPAPPPAGESDVELAAKINAFAEGEGNEEILREFKARPQPPLITAIERIRDDAEPGDSIRVKIAFLFCRLNHSYPENRAIVTGAFENPGKYEGFYEDDGVGMLAALIREGDRQLLQVAFKAAARADGALAEGLSDVYMKNLQADPNGFLLELSRVNAGARRPVYTLIGHAGAAYDNAEQVKSLLSAVPPDSKVYSVAKEMQKSLDDEAGRRK